jgi:hypothetical protein
MKTWDDVKEEIETILCDNSIVYNKPTFCDFHIPQKDISIHLAGTPNNVEYVVNAKTFRLKGFKTYITKLASA